MGGEKYLSTKAVPVDGGQQTLNRNDNPPSQNMSRSGMSDRLLSSSQQLYNQPQYNAEDRLGDVWFNIFSPPSVDGQDQFQEQFKKQMRTVFRLLSDLMLKTLKGLTENEKVYLKELAGISGLDNGLKGMLNDLNALITSVNFPEAIAYQVLSPVNESDRSLSGKDCCDGFCAVCCQSGPSGPNYFGWYVYNAGRSAADTGNINLPLMLLSPDYQQGVADEQCCNLCVSVIQKLCEVCSGCGDCLKDCEFKCEKGCEYLVGMVGAIIAAIVKFLKNILHAIYHLIPHLSAATINQGIHEGYEFAHYAYYVFFFMTSLRLLSFLYLDGQALSSQGLFSREGFCVLFSIAVGVLEGLIAYDCPSWLIDYKHMTMMSSLWMLTMLHPHVKALKSIKSCPYRWLADIKDLKEKFNLNMYGDRLGPLVGSADLIKYFNMQSGLMNAKIEDIGSWLNTLEQKRYEVEAAKRAVKTKGCCATITGHLGGYLFGDGIYPVAKILCVERGGTLKQAERAYMGMKNPVNFFNQSLEVTCVVINDEGHLGAGVA